MALIIVLRDSNLRLEAFREVAVVSGLSPSRTDPSRPLSAADAGPGGLDPDQSTY